MENIPLYNSIIIKSYIEYLENIYPDIDVKDILAYSNIANYELEDRGHWLTQEQVNRFQDYVQKVTNNPNIAREAGRYIASPKSSSHLRQYVAGFLSPTMVYWALEKVGSTISRHETIKTNKLDHHKIEIIATPHEYVKEEPFQCENRYGMFEAVTEVFTNKFAHIEHPECIHNGGKCCRYIITWDESPSFIWKRIGNYLFAATMIASIPVAFLADITHWLFFFLLALLVSVGILLHGNILNVKEMRKLLEGQGEASNQLVEQINIRYNESSLIREIGEAISNILDPRELLNRIAVTLQKRLQFNRGMIMLVNPDQTKLVYTTGFGFNQKEEALLNATDFNLTNPDSKGIFYLAYRDFKPFLVNNANDIENRLSEKSSLFMKQLAVKSFICVPIIYEGKTEGILAVDNTKSSSQPTQSDLSLLMGIARQIGISLNNALAHRTIKESEERFRNLSNNSPDIIYRLARDGKLTYVNSAWDEILGHNEGELIGKNFSDFLRDDDRLLFFDSFQKIVANKQTIRDQNFIMLNKQGLSHYITFTGTPDMDAEGRVIGIMGTLKDITKLRSMEGQLIQASKMEAIGTLAGGIAHDFNNIIQAIMGYNQLLISERRGDEQGMLYLKNIDELTQRSIELVRQLLLFSRRTDSQIKVININTEIKSMHNLLNKSIPKMIDIKTNLADNVFPIDAESVQIGQIIMNLVINARDAIGDSGNILITTRNLILEKNTTIANVTLSGGKYIELSVSDTGCGIEKNIIQLIFEPFFTTKEAGKGTGLGLSVVYGIVKSHNGFISCESEPNKGTTFHIFLPASLTSLPQRVADTHPKQLPTGNETILFVDDEKSILETGKDTLTIYGYKVLMASDGEQALELYKSSKDDIRLVILDLIMPGRGGKKCLSELLAFNPSAKVLMTSGYTAYRQETDLLEYGASGFIGKPYRPEDLLASIRRILDSDGQSV